MCNHTSPRWQTSCTVRAHRNNPTTPPLSLSTTRTSTPALGSRGTPPRNPLREHALASRKAKTLLGHRNWTQGDLATRKYRRRQMGPCPTITKLPRITTFARHITHTATSVNTSPVGSRTTEPPCPQFTGEYRSTHARTRTYRRPSTSPYKRELYPPSYYIT